MSAEAADGSRDSPEDPGPRTPPLLTSDEVATAAGVSIEDARRLWRALGFPDAGGDAAFTSSDLDALLVVSRAVAAGDLDQETATRLTRALGNTMARLADWQVSTLAEYADNRTRSSEGRDPSSALSMAQTLAPAFEQLLVYAWRRHLSAAMSRMANVGGAQEELLTSELTVGFADLVSFTQLTNRLDDDDLAFLVEAFESRCTDLITASGGRAIKTLGDSVLFVADSPTAAVAIALDIVDEIGPDATLPDVRVGLASGSVITRLGDVYGPPVNLASRLTTVARRNRVITDHVTAGALPPDLYETRSLTPRPLRGFGVVEPVTVRRRWSF
jgi:adenylate cyclase